MQRLNRIIEQYGRWDILKTYIDRINGSIQTDFSHSLENSKALIETICKEICKEKKVDIGATPSVNKLVKKASDAIGYPTSDPFNQISGSLATIGQQIGVLRNETGTTSHGKSLDELRERNDIFDEIRKELLIDSTVIIASFLIRTFENENPRTTKGTFEQNILLSDNQDFNEFWDESFGEFLMSDYSYTASEILFYTDNKAYSTELKKFEDDEE